MQPSQAAPAGTATVDEDVTLTTEGLEPGYSVRFDRNVPAHASTTCEGSMADQSFEYNEEKPLSENDYSLPGYVFGGWNTEADGTGDHYADKDKVHGLSESGETVTLYAQWSAKTYTIAYKSNNEGSQTHNQTAHFDQADKLDAYSDAAFGWNSGGRTLHGWFDDKLGLFYSDGEDFCNLCGAPKADGSLDDVTLTADWLQNGQIVVTVTKDGEPQEGLKNSLKLVQGPTEFEVPVSYEGGKYVFDPSNLPDVGGQQRQLPEGTYDLKFSATGYPSATTSITYGKDKVVSVVFDYYTVSLAKDPAYAHYNEIEMSGGKLVPGRIAAVVALDDSAVSIKTTVSAGYHFDGYTAVGVTPTWGNDGPSKAEQTIGVQGTVAIQAHVSPIGYSVTVEGGTADKTTATVGETVTITANAPVSGEAFVQWAQVDGVNFENASSATTTFTMPAKDVTVAAVCAPIVIGAIADKTYTGSPIKPTDEVKVSLDGVDLILTADDYTVSFEDYTDAGTATVIVKMKNPRMGSAYSTFEIQPADISEAVIAADSQTYDGTEHTPDPTVTWKGQTLTEGEDYEVSAYANNVHAGSATVTVKGMGNFRNTADGTFEIASLPATITVNGASKIEGDADPAFTGTVEGLIASGDLGEVSYKRTNDDEAPGTYEGVVTAEYTANNDYDVSVTKGDFAIKKRLTVKWVDGDGKVLASKDYGEGDEQPTYDGKTPTKTATKQYTYTFSGWDDGAVDGAVTTYTATFKAAPVQGTLTFNLAGGKLDGKTGKITIKANVGDEIKLPGAPTRTGYTFKYWKGSKYEAGAKYKVEGNHTFTAVWQKKGTSSSSSSNSSTTIPQTGDPYDGAAAAVVLVSGLSLALAGIGLRRRRDAH